MTTRKIPLTQGKFAIVDDDYYWELSKHKWCVSAFGYAVKKTPGTNGIIWMHRLINNTPEGFETDHINRDRLDNRKENLRTCTTLQNQANRGINKNNTSGVKGIYWARRDKRWVARIKINYKAINLGYYLTLKEAKKARLKAEKEWGIL